MDTTNEERIRLSVWKRLTSKEKMGRHQKTSRRRKIEGKDFALKAGSSEEKEATK